MWCRALAWSFHPRLCPQLPGTSHSSLSPARRSLRCDSRIALSDLSRRDLIQGMSSTRKLRPQMCAEAGRGDVLNCGARFPQRIVCAARRRLRAGDSGSFSHDPDVPHAMRVVYQATSVKTATNSPKAAIHSMMTETPGNGGKAHVKKPVSVVFFSEYRAVRWSQGVWAGHVVAKTPGPPQQPCVLEAQRAAGPAFDSDVAVSPCGPRMTLKAAVLPAGSSIHSGPAPGPWQRSPCWCARFFFECSSPSVVRDLREDGERAKSG